MKPRGRGGPAGNVSLLSFTHNPSLRFLSRRSRILTANTHLPWLREFEGTKQSSDSKTRLLAIT